MKRENGMRCEQLQRRLDDLLDKREEIGSDAELAAHAAACEACGRVVRAYESMLLAIDVMCEPELVPEGEFVRRTVDSADRQRRRTRLVRRVFAATAIAAALLIAAVPVWRMTHPTASDPSQRTIAGGTSEQTNRFAHRNRADSSPEAVARMFHATGRSLAELPETVKRVAAHPKTDQIVGSMRPLAEPVEATWEVLRRAWPATPARGTAVIPESDTGFVAWRQWQHG